MHVAFMTHMHITADVLKKDFELALHMCNHVCIDNSSNSRSRFPCHPTKQHHAITANPARQCMHCRVHECPLHASASDPCVATHL